MSAAPKNLDLSLLTTSAALFSPSSATQDDPTTTTTNQTTTTAHPTYTLPQIRAIHTALHSQVADVSARLRTQVGGSYRDLLGTADTIVAMRRDMDDVLVTLGAMGGRCGRGVVGAKVEGLRGFVVGAVERGGGGGDRGERLVLAARLYVLGRLLVKSFGEGRKEGKVEAARKSLETVHQARLTRSIDAVLRSGSGRAMKQGDVVKALGAYSLATSSGARDVLGHFLNVRARAIAMALQLDDEEKAARNPNEVLRALGLYTKTLLDVQTLVPHKLTEMLVALKQDRLLENASLKEMEGLRLDVYGRWCGDEIQFYTPFIRHDDLNGAQARESLMNWAQKGSEVLLQGLEKTLQSMTEFKAIVELRTSILKLWIAEGGKARGFDPSEMLDELRAAINKHMLRVLEAKVTKLRLVGSEVAAALDAWREGTTDRHDSLWDVASFDTDLSNGAAQFTQDVVARLYGRNDAVSKAVTSYKSWFHVIDDVGQVVDQLKRQRWDNDVDEIEDEETIEERQKLLSKDDPLALSKHLNRLLVEAFKRLDGQLMALWNARRDGPNNGEVAMYFLRLLRDIRAKLPDLEAVRSFGLSAVPSLHEAVAKAVAVSPMDEFATVALARKTVVGRSLWEGEPALPGSPSAGAFKFLRNLVTAMDDAGGDLWSPAAVGVLKHHLNKQMSKAWLEVLGGLDGEEAEAKDGAESEAEAKDDAESDAEEAEAEEGEGGQQDTGGDTKASPEQRALLVQWLMDIHYLGLFLGSNEDTLALEETVYQKSGLETPAKERLAKASQDYFKRTGLLFGLLT
ncbi:hypothetical protein C8A00DRAFT_17325 [Chaetomidium leptoderma]|uniref:Conserved oligomeric Golgi complex subunit 1 n=1 Tax=Chaetomidium leptoderma TaxID=669021 RepID=A0AAN6ZTF1_9PEZI|nr:hypothetical protein C8A00DRAFT_17325 [Chaetomidium leptoderma]